MPRNLSLSYEKRNKKYNRGIKSPPSKNTVVVAEKKNLKEKVTHHRANTLNEY